MFKYQDLVDLHLEVTSRCQASCPMCLRNFHGGGKNNLLELHDWTLQDFRNRLTEDLLRQLKGFYFCGNLGDPIINDDLLAMIEYAVSINEDLYIRVHTNGGARDTSWWKRLAEVLPKKHLVIFSLDGMRDTHSIYRIGTKFDTVLSNAKTFINNNGHAEWSFIKFKHNQHQVAEAKSLAESMGFVSFTVKNTSRFIRDPEFDVLDKKDRVIYKLKPPSDMIDPIVSQDIIDNYESIVSRAVIECPVKKEKQVFIDCKGIVYPCCWIASLPWTELRENTPANNVKEKMVEQYQKMIGHFGGENLLNLDNRTLQEILESKEWRTLENFLWEENKFIMCARTCGKTEIKFIKATEQKIEVQNFS